jgi:hypothetical protein
MMGKLCSGSCGGAILLPDEDIAIVGARKVKANKSKNSGGLIFRFLSLLTNLAIKGLFTTSFIVNDEQLNQKHSKSI